MSKDTESILAQLEQLRNTIAELSFHVKGMKAEKPIKDVLQTIADNLDILITQNDENKSERAFNDRLTDKHKVNTTHGFTMKLADKLNTDYGKTVYGSNPYPKHMFEKLENYTTCRVCHRGKEDWEVHYKPHTCGAMFYMEYKEGRYTNTSGWSCAYCKRPMEPFVAVLKSTMNSQYGKTIAKSAYPKIPSAHHATCICGMKYVSTYLVVSEVCDKCDRKLLWSTREDTKPDRSCTHEGYGWVYTADGERCCGGCGDPLDPWRAVNAYISRVAEEAHSSMQAANLGKHTHGEMGRRKGYYRATLDIMDAWEAAWKGIDISKWRN